MDNSVRRDPVQIAAEYTFAVHPACDLLPLMDDGALERLAEDVRNNGLISPIITHNGQIVDGRNRLIACRIAGVEPRFRLWSKVYAGPLTLWGWILAENVQRRHLTDEQRLAVTVALRDYEEQELARERQAAGRKSGGETAGRGRPKLDGTPGNPSRSRACIDGEPQLDRHNGTCSGDVRARLAAETGSSEYKTQQALTVNRRNPTLLRKVARGDMPLRDAFSQVRGSTPRKSSTACSRRAAQVERAEFSVREKVHKRCGEVCSDSAAGLRSTTDQVPSHQVLSEDLASRETPADMLIRAVGMILACIPQKAAITTQLRAHGGVTAGDLGAAAEVLNSFKPVIIEYGNSVNAAGSNSPATGYALPPAPDGCRANTTDREGVDSLDDFRL